MGGIVFKNRNAMTSSHRTLFCYRSMEFHLSARDCAEKLSELVWIGESLFETYRLKVGRVIRNGFKI